MRVYNITVKKVKILRFMGFTLTFTRKIRRKVVFKAPTF